MSTHLFDSTVAAISTARGKGGIAVIRVSGDDAIPICEAFVRPHGEKPLSALAANTAAVATILGDRNEPLDEGVVTVFRAPRSYTGEDVVEISCHGGVLLTEAVLSRALACGAVQAGPGEFTRRAFSAGKLSLSQAEAVIGMIDAETSSALSLSRRQLGGSIKRETDRLYDKLKAVVSGVYAAIDFPDEDLSPLTEADVRREIDETQDALTRLRDSYKTGHAVCEGVRTVIFGKPNTGKSTVLNLLLQKDRAIVTEVAGTTRDVISETVSLGDVLLRLSDTAGVREATDRIEQIGVDRSVAALRDAELILAVFDGSAPFDAEDEAVLTLLREEQARGAEILPVLNKSDLPTRFDVTEIERTLGAPLVLSAKDETARQILVDAVTARFCETSLSSADDAILTNARQAAAIETALADVKNARAALDTFGQDTACDELVRAMGKLGELDGREVGIDVVDSIFHRFCVGK